LNHATTWTSL
jgi:hypothetical protein